MLEGYQRVISIKEINHMNMIFLFRMRTILYLRITGLHLLPIHIMDESEFILHYSINIFGYICISTANFYTPIKKFTKIST